MAAHARSILHLRRSGRCPFRHARGVVNVKVATTMAQEELEIISEAFEKVHKKLETVGEQAMTVLMQTMRKQVAIAFGVSEDSVEDSIGEFMDNLAEIIRQEE